MAHNKQEIQAKQEYAAFSALQADAKVIRAVATVRVRGNRN